MHSPESFHFYWPFSPKINLIKGWCDSAWTCLFYKTVGFCFETTISKGQTEGSSFLNEISCSRSVSVQRHVSATTSCHWEEKWGGGATGLVWSCHLCLTRQRLSNLLYFQAFRSVSAQPAGDAVPVSSLFYCLLMAPVLWCLARLCWIYSSPPRDTEEGREHTFCLISLAGSFSLFQPFVQLSAACEAEEDVRSEFMLCSSFCSGATWFFVNAITSRRFWFQPLLSPLCIEFVVSAWEGFSGSSHGSKTS